MNEPAFRKVAGAVWCQSTIFTSGRKRAPANSLTRLRSPIAASCRSRACGRTGIRRRIRTFAIITTQPNELCAELHNRMPVVLKPDVWPAWLGEQPATVSDLKAMLAPYPFDEMFCWPVNTRVGNVRNNDSSLIEPVAGRIATAGRHPKPFTRAVVEYACRRWPFQNEISPLRATL